MSGPFAIASRTDDELVLERRPDYARPRPGNADTIRFLRSSIADALPRYERGESEMIMVRYTPRLADLMPGSVHNDASLGPAAWSAYIRFDHNWTYVWRNAIRPYLKSQGVLACPSNPFSHPIPGRPATNNPPKMGDNAEGWQSEPTLTMPISYAMNSCAVTWYAAADPEGKRSPPPTMASFARPADTIIICENQWPTADVHGPDWMWGICPGLFTHQAGKQANFIFFDGHAKSKKWIATLYPLTQNNWQPDEPNPDPNNRKIHGQGVGCDYTIPASPADKVFQTKDCLPVYQ